MRTKSPRIDTREYAWSSKLKHKDIQMFGKKTITKNSHIWGQILMDRAMLKGKHVWNIVIDKDSCGSKYIGVCAPTKRFDQVLTSNCSFEFFAYRSHKGNKISASGGEEAYAKSYGRGDVITISLVFQNHKGTLSFAKNDEDQGVAYEDLKPPLYPMVSLYRGDQLSILD